MTAPSPIVTNPGEAAEVLAFLDKIMQKSSEPTHSAASLVDRPLSKSGIPTLRKSTEHVKVGGSSLTGPSSSSAIPEHERQLSSGSWGWGSFWSSVSTTLQQAMSIVDEQVKSLPTQDTKKWSEGVLGYARTAQERAQEYVKNAQLEKLGLVAGAANEMIIVGLLAATSFINRFFAVGARVTGFTEETMGTGYFAIVLAVAMGLVTFDVSVAVFLAQTALESFALLFFNLSEVFLDLLAGLVIWYPHMVVGLVLDHLLEAVVDVILGQTPY
ncbi:hypothetical protein H4582DRAFT_2081273 [Lactarius indigo]|nr:hypothetical protein H4582DRAFT_2081273 [Lactarius indigo]